MSSTRLDVRQKRQAERLRTSWALTHPDNALCRGCSRLLSQRPRRGRHRCSSLVHMAYLELICQCSTCHPTSDPALLAALCTYQGCPGHLVGPHTHQVTAHR